MEGGAAHPEDRIAGDDSAAGVVYGKFHHVCETVGGGRHHRAHETDQETRDGRTQRHR